MYGCCHKNEHKQGRVGLQAISVTPNFNNNSYMVRLLSMAAWNDIAITQNDTAITTTPGKVLVSMSNTIPNRLDASMSKHNTNYIPPHKRPAISVGDNKLSEKLEDVKEKIEEADTKTTKVST